MSAALGLPSYGLLQHTLQQSPPFASSSFFPFFFLDRNKSPAMAPVSFLPEDHLLFSYLRDLNDLEKTQERISSPTKKRDFFAGGSACGFCLSSSPLAIIYLTDDDSLSSVVWPEPSLEKS